MTDRILLVEDEELIGTMIQLNLEQAGYAVTWSRNGQEALGIAHCNVFHLVLLDIALPGLDGIELLRVLRREGMTTPVMMLTARGEVQTKVTALEEGADDYLPKPFDLEELQARVKALLRRAQAGREIQPFPLIRIGRTEINLTTREAVGNHGPVVLSPKEAELIRVLVQANGQVLSRADILDEVWGMDATPTPRTVDNFMLQLRKTFEPDPEHPRHFLTVRGTGYRFVP